MGDATGDLAGLAAAGVAITADFAAGAIEYADAPFGSTRAVRRGRRILAGRRSHAALLRDRPCGRAARSAPAASRAAAAAVRCFRNCGSISSSACSMRSRSGAVSGRALRVRVPHATRSGISGGVPPSAIASARAARRRVPRAPARSPRHCRPAAAPPNTSARATLGNRCRAARETPPPARGRARRAPDRR